MKIELERHEINKILFSLAKEPYEEVVGIISHIKEQITKEEAS